MLELVCYLLGALAVTAAIQGCRMLATAYLGDGRYWARRLAPSQGPVPGAGPKKDGGWLEQKLNSRTPIVQERLAMAGVALRSDQVVSVSLLLSAIVMLVLRLCGQGALLSLLAAVAVGVAGPSLVLGVLIQRRRRRFLAQMPQTIDLMARSLQAGHPVTTAITLSARQMPDPIGSELGVVVAEMSFGLDRDAAFRNLLRRFPLPELRLLVASLEVTRETGGNIAEVLLRLSDTMRAKNQLRKKVRAVSAEGRLTLFVASGLPPIVGLLLSLIRPGYYSEVASQPLFWPLMALPPVLVAIGALIIWRMVNFRI